MAKLLYTPCNCIRRGVCFVPGKRGHLSVVVKGRTIKLRRCLYCRKKDDRLINV